jgi:DNA-binding MarR family transcriptional regulator
MKNEEQIKVVRDGLRKFNRRAGVLKSDPYGIGLTLSQSSALIDIERFGTVKANDLVRLLHLEKSSVSRLVMVLQERGLVKISDDPSDGRSKVLSLTKAGEKAVNVINEASNLSIQEAFSKMDTKTKQEVSFAFEKLIKAIGDLESL